MQNREKTVKMTEGSIPRLLISFAIPLLLGNIFQQLYNMVDSWVVGNYVSNEAFSAVGTVGPIINMLIGFFMGLSSGAGVVVSQYFGAGKEDKIHDTVHTAIMMTVIFAIALTALGLFLAPTLLNLMNTPSDVYQDALTYLDIYFAGVSGLLFYNIGASILQAVGDSRRPFMFLATSAVINIVGDLVFVIVFGMGVEGVAYATILSQAISAILTISTLVRSQTVIKLRLNHIRIHMEQLKRIIHVGIPAALQMSLISFSNIFVQSYINQFGSDVMSGWTAYSKIDALMLLPMQSIGLSTSTFVGQNIGLGQVDRVKSGVRISMIMSLIATVIPMIPVMIFAPQLVAFFNSKAEVVTYGTMILRVMSPFYAITCSGNVHSSALRGAGDTRFPMFSQLFSFVVFRQIYLFVVSNYISNTVIWIIMGYPMGWILNTILMAVYYARTDLLSHSVRA